MHGVWYAAVAAVFVLGLLFVAAYARRGTRATPPPGRHHAADAAPVAAVPPADLATLRAQVRDELRAEVRDEVRDELRAQLRADVRDQVQDELRAEVREQVRAETETVRDSARAEAQATLSAARAEAARLRDELATEREAHAARVSRLHEVESRLDDREVRLGQRAEQLQARADELAEATRQLEHREQDLRAARRDLDAATAEHQGELERIAGLTADEARAELLAGVETGARRDAAVLVRSIENEARAEATDRARGIVADAVQRVAGAQTAESVVSVLHLPAEEMKGRIIGREGRNIRSFEAVTGVNVIIDDTPEAVLLSCFDPVRREVARLTLDKLVTDGRIHPHRIEEAYEHSRAEVDELCLRAARDAVAEVGVGAVDERLLPVLGRLKYRTSYGQNVLAHLLETAHVAGVMAAELGIDPTVVKRSAFLHDIGKALTHEVEGSHALVGAELLRKYGEDEAVVHAVEAHHNEVQPRTIEAVLTQASDTCSASRPGARRESVESYVKRLARIEQIAGEHDGVEKVFAMQAGREVRVMVQPGSVDDLAASVMAREIAKQIEDELTYPGQIRVTVVRETRSTEIAH